MFRAAQSTAHRAALKSRAGASAPVFKRRFRKVREKMTALRNFFITFLLSLLIFGLLAYGAIRFASSAFGLSPNPSGGDLPSDSGETPAGPSGPGTPSSEWQDVDGESFTVLLVGTDYQPSFYNDYDVTDEVTETGFPKEPRKVETDTIVLVRVSKETGECLFCPIPANTRITCDGLPVFLRDLYSLKGIDALCTKILTMTGIPVDYYAVINIENFITVIDELGGLQYYVETDMYFVDEEAGLHINLRKGTQKLDGKNALDMLRYCEYSDGDVSRRRCAVSFLKEFFKKIFAPANYADAQILYRKFSGYFETNFTADDLVGQVDLIFAYPKMTLRDYTYPGTTVGSGENAYFSPNTAEAIEFYSNYKFKG